MGRMRINGLILTLIYLTHRVPASTHSGTPCDTRTRTHTRKHRMQFYLVCLPPAEISRLPAIHVHRYTPTILYVRERVYRACNDVTILHRCVPIPMIIVYLICIHARFLRSNRNQQLQAAAAAAAAAPSTEWNFD